MPEKLFHAVKDGRLIDILDISADDWGLKCGCACAGCGAPLVAHNRAFEGRKKAVYFSHHSDADCRGARESALHLLAKEVAEKSPELVFPELKLPWDEGYGSGGLIAGTKMVRVTNPESEPWVDGVRPDMAVTASSINKTVYLEFKVTHEVETPKANLARKSGWLMIEYDLSDLLKIRFDRALVRKRLTDVTEAHFHKWVWHPWITKIGKRFRKSVQLLQKGRKCPAGLGIVEGPYPRGIYKYPHAPCFDCPAAAFLKKTGSQGCTFSSGIIGFEAWVKSGFKPNSEPPFFITRHQELFKKARAAEYAAKQEWRREKEHNRVRREGDKSTPDLITTDQDWAEIKSLLERVVEILKERRRAQNSHVLGIALHLVDTPTNDVVSRGGFLVSTRAITELDPGARFTGHSRVEVGTIHKTNGTWHLESREPDWVKIKIEGEQAPEPPASSPE